MIIKNNHSDSSRLNYIKLRKNDIFILTYIRSGTALAQEIIRYLIFGFKQDVPVAHISPWVDFIAEPIDEIANRLENQNHRRFMKTHLPFNALPYSENVKYLFIGRDGRDIARSAHNHYINLTDEFLNYINSLPQNYGNEIRRPDNNLREYILSWIINDGKPLWSFQENIKSIWNVKHLPNVKLMHYNNLNQNLEKSINEIAEFIEIDVNQSTIKEIAKRCHFSYMKKHSLKTVPLEGIIWKDKEKNYFFKGKIGEGKKYLTPTENLLYEKLMEERLGYKCANWLKTGL
ncbi:MAG: sulfotransferase domain-containing protein [Candidatus Woesearchaeota archaeon]